MNKQILKHYDSMTSFFEDEFDRLDDGLKDTISETQLRKMKEKFLGTMRLLSTGWPIYLV